MKLRNIYLYSGYRKDGIHDISGEAMIAIRAANNFHAVKLIDEWKENVCELQTDRKVGKYPLKKVKLNDEGFGKMEL